MRVPEAAEILELWERTRSRTGVEVADEFVRAGGGGGEADIAAMRVGERNIALLATRTEWFGSDLDLTAPCPACGEMLEASVDTGALMGALPPPTDEVVFATGDTTVRCRAVTVADLRAAAAADDGEHARAVVMRRCVAADAAGEAVAGDRLPDDVAQRAVAALADADPAALIEVRLSCPDCGHDWTTPFDATAVLWSEVDRWTRDLLYDIQVLARFYGWSEGDVLAMSTARRAIYLEGALS